jgi:hypothetical protein
MSKKACGYKKWTSVQIRIRGKSPPEKEEKKIKIAHVFL